MPSAPHLPHSNAGLGQTIDKWIGEYLDYINRQKAWIASSKKVVFCWKKNSLQLLTVDFVEVSVVGWGQSREGKNWSIGGEAEAHLPQHTPHRCPFSILLAKSCYLARSAGWVGPGQAKGRPWLLSLHPHPTPDLSQAWGPVEKRAMGDSVSTKDGTGWRSPNLWVGRAGEGGV